jgi:hypothetical protein
MPTFTRAIAITLVGLAMLAACADQESDCRVAIAGPLYMNTNSVGISSMHTKNNGQWCAMGITSPIAGMDVRLARDPSHGIARVAHQRDKVIMGYLPNPGYTGDDSFRVLLSPGNVELQINVTVAS